MIQERLDLAKTFQLLYLDLLKIYLHPKLYLDVESLAEFLCHQDFVCETFAPEFAVVLNGCRHALMGETFS